MLNQKELNLKQRRWLKLLKDYDMSILYHTSKAYVVVDDIRRLSVGSTSHYKEEKKKLAKICTQLHVWMLDLWITQKKA